MQFPAVGLGTWQGSPGTSDAESLKTSIIHALKSGYRMIDTAQAYGVEPVVGDAVRESGVPRSEICLVSKFWAHFHHDPAQALRISLENLKLDYVDIYLMHWPTAESPDKKTLGINDSPTFTETWKLMEPLVGKGTKAIGVSNFTEKTLEVLLKEAKIVPVVNQVELHALNPCLKLVPYCQSKGIVVTSWSTLGGSSFGKNEIMTNDLFADIAKAHGCGVGAVSLSWAVQRGIAVIPKSSSPSRIEENIRLVTLSNAEMDRMNEAHTTLGPLRLAGSMKNTDGGKPTLFGWTYEEFGWEDAEGNWLT